jgi:hypothetical protein
MSSCNMSTACDLSKNTVSLNHTIYILRDTKLVQCDEFDPSADRSLTGSGVTDCMMFLTRSNTSECQCSKSLGSMLYETMSVREKKSGQFAKNFLCSYYNYWDFILCWKMNEHQRDNCVITEWEDSEWISEFSPCPLEMYSTSNEIVCTSLEDYTLLVASLSLRFGVDHAKFSWVVIKTQTIFFLLCESWWWLGDSQGYSRQQTDTVTPTDLCRPPPGDRPRCNYSYVLCVSRSVNTREPTHRHPYSVPTRWCHRVMSPTYVSTRDSFTVCDVTVGIPIDSGMGLSIRIDKLRVLSIKRYQLRILSTNYW